MHEIIAEIGWLVNNVVPTDTTFSLTSTVWPNSFASKISSWNSLIPLLDGHELVVKHHFEGSFSLLAEEFPRMKRLA
jgi:hypothetical protein